jgi:hypothetical protein
MLAVTFGTNKVVGVLQASDGEKSDQDLVVDDASEVIIKNFNKSFFNIVV